MPAATCTAWGVVLYRLLTGELPFRGNKRMLIVQVLQDEPRPPRRLNDHIPRDLETITLKCLAKEPARRYATADLFAEELRRWLRGEPILARPVGHVEQLWRWAKRNPRVAGLSAAVAALLLVVAIGSSAAAVIFTKQRDHAVRLAAETNRLAEQERQARDETELRRQEADDARRQEQQARNDADERRQEAEKARDETKQVLDYLVAAFRKSDPEADGEKLTVAALLGQAAEQLETAFPNQPLIQAQLLSAIGQTYSGLGLYQKAAAVHERARDLRRNELGEEHEDTLKSTNNLAHAFQLAGRLDEALPLFEETLERRKTTLGPDHRETLLSMNNLAAAYQAAGRVDEALSLKKQTFELRKGKLGPQHPDTLVSMNNLAFAYQSAGRLEEAVLLYAETLERRKTTLGPQHPLTLLSMNNLAVAYAFAGRLEEALPLFEQTLELRKTKLGAEHPDTLLLMYSLGRTYQAAKQPAKAETMLRECLTIRQRVRPQEWWTFETQLRLGVVLAERKNFEQAGPMLLEGYQGLIASLATIPSSDRDRLQLARQQIVQFYEAWEKPAEAEKWRAK